MKLTAQEKVELLSAAAYVAGWLDAVRKESFPSARIAWEKAERVLELIDDIYEDIRTLSGEGE